VADFNPQRVAMKVNIESVSEHAQALTEDDWARLLCRVPKSKLGKPKKGASRTPALLLPIMAEAFFISSEK
jgi:hypothetical protein